LLAVLETVFLEGMSGTIAADGVDWGLARWRNPVPGARYISRSIVDFRGLDYLVAGSVLT